MRVLRSGFSCSLVIGGVLFPLALAAQSRQAPSGSGAALNEQQAMGRRLYNQNCRLCHAPRPVGAKDPNLEDNVGPNLAGVFGPPRSRPEVAVRAFIEFGIPDRMPGFRYGLQTAETDAIIAYLRIL